MLLILINPARPPPPSLLLLHPSGVQVDQSPRSARDPARADARGSSPRRNRVEDCEPPVRGIVSGAASHTLESLITIYPILAAAL